MPGPINGADAYSELKALQRYALNSNVWENTTNSLQERTRRFLQGHGPEIQFKRDVALWYGAITDCGEPWKGEFLLRVFATLYWGGLLVKRTAGWVPYCTQRIPICSAISHTARVLIQLPHSDYGKPRGETFWGWLWGNEEPRTRMAATHGIEPLTRAETIGSLATKKVKELKKNRNVRHFGVNLALGGCGNHNIISGNRIDHQSGHHGHLYLGYYSDENRRQVPRAILIGAEQSAPNDRAGRTQGSLNTAILHLAGVSDQYGGKHSILGGHSRYSATGGDDFAYTSHGEEIAGARLYQYGPSRENYYDGMFIDLNEERFELVKTMVANGSADVNLIGRPGGPPTPSKQGRPTAPRRR